MNDMATASPTPAGAGSNFTSLGRRTSARQALRRPSSRPQMNRSESNPVPGTMAAGRDGKAQSQQQQQYSTLNDSSDDEIPVPMKLSALTKAILNDGGASEASNAPAPAAHGAVVDRPVSPPARPASRVSARQRNVLSVSTSSAADEKEQEKPAVRTRETRETRRHVRAGSAQISSSRPTSPARSRETSPAPRKRVVRLSTTPAGGNLQNSLRRSLSASTQRKRPESRDRSDEKNQVAPPAPEPLIDVNTPVVPVRKVTIAVGSSGAKARSSLSSGVSSKRSAGYSDQEMPEDPATVGRPQAATSQGSVSRFGASGRKEEAGPQSTRFKRVPKVPGGFLSGPARRGRRRPSEEDAEEHGDGDMLASSQEPESQQPHDMGNDLGEIPASSFFASSYRDYAASGSPVSSKDSARALRKQASNANIGAAHHNPELEKSNIDLLAYKIPAPPQALSALGKENEAPPIFKKPSPAPSVLPELGKPSRPLSMDLGSAARSAAASPDRKALAPKSQNTPHRPAPPPPPKMSVVETATAAAGAATTAPASKKRATLLKVNGRMYTRIDCLGRGGSGKVYRVSAENGRMFALKRVPLENADENLVRGFKGEIDLLSKLNGVDRVIQLVDYEMNEEKKMLSVLMEAGELDLNTLLKIRQSPDSKLDPVFVRYYWKEMLESVQAVHAHDIVHSDLKPANFVLVQGRLKLIDFGIANAIQTDETVNVHRETMNGTPNYMSPESLMDSNQYAFTASAYSGNRNGPPPPFHKPGGPKLVKLGKPSDIWSLGCILYQMVYGLPPFGQIQHHMSRYQAIINWSHRIDFPERGMGGVRVPPSLVRTMRRCLNREQRERPTCEELLSETDPFLHPPEFDADLAALAEGKVLPMTEELLGRIIQSVVQRCKERIPTEGEAMSAWPNAYWASVRKAVAPKDGRA